jgi:hypothetical protein
VLVLVVVKRQATVFDLQWFPKFINHSVFLLLLLLLLNGPILTITLVFVAVMGEKASPLQHS